MDLQKGNLTIILGVTLVVCVLVAVLILTNLLGMNIKLPKWNQSQNYQLETPLPSIPNPTPVADNAATFDVEKAKIGDKVGGMTITKIRGYKTDQASGDNAFVDFLGTVVLTGEVTHNPPGSQGGELICMKGFDKDSQAKMPKLSSQKYTDLAFCFTNTALAKNLLLKGDPKDQLQGTATVTIKNYKIQWFPIEVHNTADLVSAP